MTYDEWKTTDPRDSEPHFLKKCPWCKGQHWEHEKCSEAEYNDQDNTGDEENDDV